MKGLLVIILGCCVIIHNADCQNTLVTCALWQNCLRPMQVACNEQGQRQVCLMPNLVAPCTQLGGFVSFCAIQSGIPVDIEKNVTAATSTTCGMFTGGQMASFSVGDGNVSVNALGTITNVAASTITFAGTTVTATCTRRRLINQCNTGNSANGTYLLNFATMPCDCTCTPWSAFGTCGPNCMRTRTRTCTPPTGSPANFCTDPTTETIGCQGGACNACTCQTTPSAWSACTATCGGGTRTRTRTCTRTVGSPTTTVCANMVETEVCNAQICTGVVTTPPPPTATCTCTSFANVGGCSGTCGIGVQTQSKVCSAGCGINAGQRTVTFSCETGRACPTVPPAVAATCTCTTFSLRSYSVCLPSTCTILQFRDCSSTCPTGTTVQIAIPCPDATSCIGVNPILMKPLRPIRPRPVRPRRRRNRNRGFRCMRRRAALGLCQRNPRRG